VKDPIGRHLERRVGGDLERAIRTVAAGVELLGVGSQRQSRSKQPSANACVSEAADELHEALLQPRVDAALNPIRSTLTGNCSNRDLPEFADFALTPLARKSLMLAREEAQGLCHPFVPDDFVLTGSYAQQWERLGRAVPPTMMFHVAKTICDEILT